MENQLPKNVLKKYPQLRNIFDAIEFFHKTGKQRIRCKNCYGIIKINENKEEGLLETNCECGRCKYRARWDPKKNKGSYMDSSVNKGSSTIL